MPRKSPEGQVPFDFEEGESKVRKVRTKSGQEIEIDQTKTGTTFRGLEEPECPTCAQGHFCKKHSKPAA